MLNGKKILATSPSLNCNEFVVPPSGTRGPQGFEGRDGRDGKTGATGSGGRPGTDGRDGGPGRTGATGKFSFTILCWHSWNSNVSDPPEVSMCWGCY